MDRPELSLCIIFRDEEAMLPDFIASVAGLWDEFVAVDTGSRDRSADLLRGAGARVSEFTWCDDFAAARNASLKEATGRWILFLDADERPDEGLKQQIRVLLKDPTAGAASVMMRNEWPDGTVRQSSLLRLFRNDASIGFRYRIHEDVSEDVQEFLRREGLALRHLTGEVRHLGYTREVARSRDKKERDLELLRLSLADAPRDFYCWFKILEIARFWQDEPLWTGTAVEVVRLLDTLSDQEAANLRGRPFSGEMVALVAQGLPGSDSDRLAWLEKAAADAAPHPALELRRGLLLENLGRLEEAAACFHDGLQLAANHPGAELRPRLALCRLALARGARNEALEHAARAVTLNPLDPEARLAAVSLAETLVSAGSVKEAACLLDPLAPHDADSALGYLLCCLCLDRDLDLQVDVEPDAASGLFREWIRRLWSSRRIEVMEKFADGCGSVLGIFPWLPDFLQEETDRLRREG